MKTKYPSLVKWIEEEKVLRCPIQVTLGLGSQYHIKMKNGLQDYHLSPQIFEGVGSPNQISRVWFGCEDAWIVEMGNGVWKWNLGGKYG